jgi:hypothetical protein
VNAMVAMELGVEGGLKLDLGLQVVRRHGQKYARRVLKHKIRSIRKFYSRMWKKLVHIVQ